MPWKEKTIEMERREFVERALKGIESKSALCRQFGISRPTGDKWIRRLLETGSLQDLDRTPIHQPLKTDWEMEQKIIAMRAEYPFLGARKLHRLLLNSGMTDVPSPSTINQILKRNGLILPQASQAATPYHRFEMPEPNDMWQTDYKGHFPMKDGVECHPLNIIDDHSRFSLCSRAMTDEQFASFQPVLTELFLEYGMPKYFLSDNGNPWGNGQKQGYSRVDVWLMRLGVLPIHGRLFHPQTQGKDESFNRALTRECLKGHMFANKEETQMKLDEYRKFYNEIRPHHALKLDTPVQHYRKSCRQYPGLIEKWEYPQDRQLRLVHGNGHFKYDGYEYYIGEAFLREYVALRESHRKGYVTVEFRNFRVARINTGTHKLENRRAYLLEEDPRNT